MEWLPQKQNPTKGWKEYADDVMRFFLCDLDGKGAEWRLAVSRGRDWHFPVEDFDEDKRVLEDDRCVWLPVMVPKFPIPMKDK